MKISHCQWRIIGGNGLKHMGFVETYMLFSRNGDISFYQRGLLAIKHITHRDKYYEGPEVTFYDSTMD